MDRGRDRDRDNRDIRRGPRIETTVERDGVTTMLGAGESYRPNLPNGRPRTPPRARTPPPRADTYRADRDRSPRRARSPPITDSYHPNSRDRSPRRKSPLRRSPSRDNWRAARSPPRRARSPPRRYSPPRDDDRRDRARSPRNDRRRSRSPYTRDRPTTRRSRSPIRRISPPAGPRGSHRAARSPDRRDDRIPGGPSSSNWRRHSPSPPRDSGRSSVRTSGSNSRRSSPHVHPSRLAAVQLASRARSPPMSRERSPPAQLSYRDRESTRSTPRDRSPVRPKSPPRGPATSFRPPTGPSGGRNFTAPSPSPTMSASGPPASISAHNRSDNAPIAPPAGPRSQFAPSRGGYVGRGGRGSFHDRQGRPDPASWGAAPSRPVSDFSPRPARPAEPVSRPPPASSSVPTGPSSSVPTGPSGGIPTGPKAGAGIPSRPSLQHSSSIYGSRNQAPAPGPRPHPAMANMPQIIPGGRIDPIASGMSSETTMRLKRREDEEVALRADLEAKEDAARKNMREFDRMKNESAQWALRSELSAKHLSALVGDGVGGPAF